MSRKIIGVLAALALATVGTLVLVGWAQSAEDRALEGQRTVDVLVVQEPVPEGTRAEDLGERVATEQVVAQVKADGSVDDIDELEGKVAAVDLVPGEQVLSARFVEPEALARETDIEVPEGLQEVTISVGGARALGGNVRPGDTVGLVATFGEEDAADGSEAAGGGESAGDDDTTRFVNETSLILHKLLVTRVQAAPVADSSGQGEETEDDGLDPLPSSELLITLAVDAPSVERIVFVQEFGATWLTLEPETATEDGTTIQRRDTIFE